MKKLFSFMLLSAVMFLAVSCKDKKDEEQQEAYVPKYSMQQLVGYWQIDKFEMTGPYYETMREYTDNLIAQVVFVAVRQDGSIMLEDTTYIGRLTLENDTVQINFGAPTSNSYLPAFAIRELTDTRAVLYAGDDYSHVEIVFTRFEPQAEEPKDPETISSK